MKNIELSEIFNNIADILEIKGENRFRVRAYRRAAQTMETLKDDVSELIEKDALLDLPGIGKDLAGKIKEYTEKGKIEFYEELKKESPGNVLELMNVPGIGPKTAKVLAEKFKIKNISDLERKARSGKIEAAEGIKEKTISNILRGIDFLKKSKGKYTLDAALKVAESMISALRNMPETEQIQEAGSLRRRKETVRDIDILATSDKPRKIMEKFVKLPEVKEVLLHGPTRSTVITKDGLQVDLRVVEPESYGAALCYLTGSKEHNVRLRKMAVAKKLKINEYGVFKIKGNRKIAGSDEEGIYKTLGLDYVPPEMREDRGEIELASRSKLPNLVELKDIRGDLHVHSEYSDGVLALNEIAQAGRGMGYEYIVVTDHSKSLKIAHGLTEKDLFAKIEKIRKINKKLSGKRTFRLLAGAEVDIMNDGSLDYDDSVLRQLDFVIAAIHAGFKQPSDRITFRIIKAMENKYVNMIAHPTGRLLGTREPYEINMEKVLKSAKDTGTFIEINAYPERLDIDDNTSRKAKELGVMVGISTDTHTNDQFSNMAYGVSVARRGWLEKKDILNTLLLKDFLKKISAKSNK